MSVESVRNFFKEKGLEDLLLYSEITADTVEHAAKLWGCEPRQIAKTMSFLVGEEPIVIVSSGEARIDNSKYKAKFHTKARMIPFDLVEQYTGHIPGGVSPFALKPLVKVYLDVSLKRFDIVYAGAGDEHNTVKVTIPELEEFSAAESWVDVCNNWEN